MVVAIFSRKDSRERHGVCVVYGIEYIRHIHAGSFSVAELSIQMHKDSGARCWLIAQIVLKYIVPIVDVCIK